MSTLNETDILDLGFHVGNTVKILASQYPDVNQALLEVLQNVLDAESSKCEVTVNLHFGSITVVDNGSGADRKRMNATWENIAESRKLNERVFGQRRTFGQFGIGILAPVDKLDSARGVYTITTGPRQGRGESGWEGYHTYSLTQLIRGECQSVVISNDGDSTENLPWWSTKIEIRGVTKEQANLFSLDKVFNGLQRFSSVIDHCAITFEVYDRRNHSNGVVRFQRQRFTGHPVEVPSCTFKGCGEVSFELYFNERGSNKNNLFLEVGGSGQLIAWTDLSRQIGEHVGQLHEDAVAVYDSNHFEGIITAERGSLAPNATAWWLMKASSAYCVPWRHGRWTTTKSSWRVSATKAPKTAARNHWRGIEGLG